MKSIQGRRWRRAACFAAVVVLAIACGVLANCSTGSGSADSETQLPEITSEALPSTSESAPAEATASSNEIEKPQDGVHESKSESIATPSGITTSQDAVSGVSGAASQTGSTYEETPPTSAPATSGGESQKQLVWMVDYEDVWVEDSPEWDESVPIHGYTEVSVCNICGADITGNTAAHGKQHMLAGEGSGHHSEVRETVTGYDTVHHDAVGHWERVESGGHWE